MAWGYAAFTGGLFPSTSPTYVHDRYYIVAKERYYNGGFYKQVIEY
jgi:hypothetical protein